MKICIVGWYGTETLGDRAILDGIVSIFQKCFSNNSYCIGSLFPLLTERTLFEDSSLLNSHGGKADFCCFDVKDIGMCKKVLNGADAVIMGGGPLMDIQEMYSIERMFIAAKKHNIPTMLFGCGFGPLNSKEYIGRLKKILKFSDLIIMRSENCKSSIEKYTTKNVYYLCDPAIISALDYKRRVTNFNKKRDLLLINFRDLDYVYKNKTEFVSNALSFVAKFSSLFERIVLYPMHTFSVGGDDRIIENRIALINSKSNVEVINKPLSLSQCYDLIASSNYCVGTRYHSIVFQSILNGNNYILDYTKKENGKIASFLKQYGMFSFYKDRYVNLFENKMSDLNIEKQNQHFSFKEEIINNEISEYISLIKSVIKL